MSAGRFLLALAVAGLMLIGMAVPLVRDAVPPNLFYGLKTPATLADEDVWYAANRFAGGALAVAGVVSLLGTALLGWLRERLDLQALMVAGVTLLLACVLCALGTSLWYLYGL